MTLLLLAVGTAAMLGYLARGLVDRRRVLERERTLRALGGQLPDWEQRARELETRAYTLVSAMTQVDTAVRAASMLREEADTTRKRGRERDKEWK